MTQVTFFKSTKYAGGRSHRNITTLECYGYNGDIFDIADNKGLHVYPIEGEDFENGVNDWNGNMVMDSDGYRTYCDTGIGCLDFTEERIYSTELSDIDNDEFCELPKELMLEYINSNLDNDIPMQALNFALSKDEARWVYDYRDTEWGYVLAEMNESKN